MAMNMENPSKDLVNEVDHVDILDASFDAHGGVIINVKDDMDEHVFTTLLRTSISQWRKLGKKGVWLKLSLELVNLVKPAVKEGFWYHHAEPTYVMLVYWIPETDHALPPNASHRVGVASFVVNSKEEVLVVQEKNGAFKGSGVWKLPTGTVEEGEDISAAAIREVKEEAGGFAQFQNPQTQPFNLAEPKIFPETQPLNDDDEEVEETQLTIKPTRRRSHKKKLAMASAKETEASRTVRKWTTEEEVILARAWLDVSESPISGNSQKSLDFWNTIAEKFFEAMKKPADYRTVDQLSSKWRHINTKVKKFAARYDECTRSKKSGTTHEDFIKQAIIRFQDDACGVVPLELWYVLSKSPKWQEHNEEQQTTSSKRSAANIDDHLDPSLGASSRVQLDLDKEEDNIPRPVGMKKSKSSASESGSASGSLSSIEDIGKQIVENMKIFNLRQEEKAERRRAQEKRAQEEAERKRAQEKWLEEKEDMEILDINLNTLTGYKRIFYEKKQNEIRQKYDLN